jgi:hypothetical protein
LDHRFDIDCEFFLGRPTAKHHKIISSWCLKVFLFGFREIRKDLVLSKIEKELLQKPTPLGKRLP